MLGVLIRNATAVWCVIHAGSLVAADLDGIYHGSMRLHDGESREIPLTISLLLTSESINTPNGNQYVIDGACVIDDAGGPYTFVKVSYDLDDNVIDMRYSRPRNDPNSESPASFRLTGSFTNDDEISGRVTSGLFGAIGEFKVVKDRSRRMLSISNKYMGRWAGRSTYADRPNQTSRAEVFIGKGLSTSINPQEYEFEYTPSLSGGYKIDGVSIVSFSTVAVDYLRRTVLLQDMERKVTIKAKIDFANNTLSGEQYSWIHGLTTIFDRLQLVP